MRCLGTIAVSVLLALSAGPVARAQGLAQTLATAGDEGPDGLHLYSISVYSEYTSTVIPFGASTSFNSTLPVGLSNLGPNYLGGILAKVGYRKTGARTNFYVTYVPSYDASFRYSSLNSMNHFLTFGLIHDFGPKWTVTLSGAGLTARYDQFFFDPTIFDSLVAVPATFDELSQAILSGKYTSGQLASILTGAPLIESPATTLLYGPRILDASLRTDFSYEQSGRLHYHFGFGATRMQGLNSGKLENSSVSLLPQTTSPYVSTGLTYALSPFTDVEVDLMANRTFSRFEDAYISNGTIGLNRALGRSWIVGVKGGGGVVNPVRSTFTPLRGPHYLAGGSVTYKTLSNAFMASYDRTITDFYGLGALNASIASGAWTGHIPGRSWSVNAGARYESIANIGGYNLNAWLGDAGINRRFGLHSTVQLAYIYGRMSGVITGLPEKRSLQGVRLVITWSPFLPLGM